MAKKKADSLKFGEARAELEQILKEIEANEVDVDDLAEKIRRAAALIRVCRDKLERTRTEVEKIVSEMEDVEPEPAGRNEDQEDSA